MTVAELIAARATDTTTGRILTLTLTSRRWRAEGAVQGFRDGIAKNGIGHTISWSATPAIIGEMVIDALDRFDKAVTEHGVDRAVEMAGEVREDRARQLSYFDPTSTSTSASGSMVSAAEFQGRRAVVEILDEIAEAHKVDREG